MPLAKVAHLLRTTFGLQVTTGRPRHVLLDRAARAAAPAYAELSEQVRNALRGHAGRDRLARRRASRHWLWAFVTPAHATVYAIGCPGRGFADAATVLGTDYAGPLCSCADGLGAVSLLRRTAPNLSEPPAPTLTSSCGRIIPTVPGRARCRRSCGPASTCATAATRES